MMWPIRVRSKFGSRKAEVDGYTFDSQREARYYLLLKALKLAGEIVTLDRQVRFPIVVNGAKVCTYVADFVTVDKAGKKRVIDVKGFKTPTYRLKRKLMAAVCGIEIEEV